MHYRRLIRGKAKLSNISYICEICMERLDNIDDLHKHRSAVHNASVGV
jgi:hypothetical protein